MTPLDTLGLQLLDRLEREEFNALTWGFVEGAFNKDAVLQHGDEILRHAADPETNDPEGLFGWLEQRRLLFELPFDAGRYRTRFAEAVRLLFNLRQLWPGRPWDAAANLVADYRLSLRARRFPDFVLEPEDVIAQAEKDIPWRPREREILTALLARQPRRRLARFQAEGLRIVRRHLRTAAAHGTIVTAGTGSGKTLAAYLPALVEVGRLVEPGQFWTKMLCVYPRNELLKDQLYKVLQETDRMAGASLPRPVRLGAFFHATPSDAVYAHEAPGWEWRGDGIVCPYLRCPTCGGVLIWRNEDRKAGRERLRCLGCGREIGDDRVVLTRSRMVAEPPDLLFTSTESLNRQLASSRFQGIFGVGLAANRTPRLVLLDEVHTYDGIPGAQVALLLRRWRHAVRRRPVQWVGLSATLRNPVPFFAQLTDLAEERVVHLDPGPDEIEGGLEYLLAVRGDPASRRSLLSTTIQTAMLLGRTLDPQPPNPGVMFTPPSQGIFGRRAFLFSDDLDVINRLYHDLLDAEAAPPRFGWKDPLANLRDPNLPDPEGRNRFGQNWWMPAALGHRLDSRKGLKVCRTTAQDRGVEDLCSVVVCSSALEVGYDDEHVGAVLQHKAPHSLASFLQRKGRAGRLRGMRPWTVLILSDYGRDRLAYQAPEQIFDPTLPPRSLPVRNRYVLRMQAVFSFLDWLAQQAARQNKRFSVWTALTEPARDGTRRAQQEWLASQIREVIELPERTEELTRHLEGALGASRDAVLRLLWEAPRPLMSGVLPTALRRLTSNWAALRADGTVGRDVVQQFNPLPEFMPANLFSDLQLPELVLVLPTPKRESMHESMPLLQGMQTFAPGKVSRRFATDRSAEMSHWIAIAGTPQEDLPLEKFCMSYLDLGEFAIRDEEGAVQHIPCVRPLEYQAELCDEDKVSVSSNSFLHWHSQLFAAQPGLPLALPVGPRWADLELRLELFTHTRFSPAGVRRFATGADADLRRRGEEATPCVIRFTRGPDARPAALGFELTVDGMRLRYRLPRSSPERWLTPELLRAARPLFFRQRVHADEELRPLANHFLLQWLAEIHLATLLGLAAVERLPLPEASERLATEYPARVTAVMDDVLQMIERENGEQEDESNLRTQLLARLTLPLVRQRLREAATVLWESPSPAMLDWCRRRFRTTLGTAFLDACYQVASQVEVGDLLLDLDPGLALDGAEPSAEGEQELWITEASPGGCGVIEAIGRAIRGEPRRFLEALHDALGPSEFELIDQQLALLVGALAAEEGPLARIVAEVREARTLDELATARDRLLGELAAAGYVLSRPFLVAVNARLLPPHSGPQRDHLLAVLLRLRERLESELGVEISHREFAYVAAREEDVRAAVAATVGADVEGHQLYRILAGLLWPRASLVRTTGETAHNPFASAAPPDRCLLRQALLLDKDQIDTAESGWRARLQQTLDEAGRAVLRLDGTDRRAARAMLLELSTTPLDLGYLRVFPQVEGLAVDGPVLLLTVRLREART